MFGPGSPAWVKELGEAYGIPRDAMPAGHAAFGRPAPR